MKHSFFLLLLSLLVTNFAVAQKRKDVDLSIPDVERKDVICFTLYTVSDNTQKLTAQLYPLNSDDPRIARLEIEKDGKTKLYLDDINTYLENKKINSLNQLERTKKKSKPNFTKTTSNYKLQKKEKSLKNKLSKLESNITKLEKEIRVVDLELEINYEQTISDKNFFESYHEKKKELSNYIKNWERLVEEIENLNQY